MRLRHLSQSLLIHFLGSIRLSQLLLHLRLNNTTKIISLMVAVVVVEVVDTSLPSQLVAGNPSHSHLEERLVVAPPKKTMVRTKMMKTTQSGTNRTPRLTLATN